MRRASEHARFRSAVRSQLVDLLGMAICCWSRFVRSGRAASVHHGVKMLEVLIVEISIGLALARLRMRLVDLIAGLIEQDAVVVLHRQLDIGGTLLGKPGRETMAGQRHSFD